MSLFLTVLLWSALGGAVGGAIGAIIDLVFVDEDLIKQDVRNSNALYGEITNRQRNTLTVDQIDRMGDVTKKIEYHTQEEINKNLYVGKRIYA